MSKLGDVDGGRTDTDWLSGPLPQNYPGRATISWQGKGPAFTEALPGPTCGRIRPLQPVRPNIVLSSRAIMILFSAQANRKRGIGDVAEWSKAHPC